MNISRDSIEGKDIAIVADGVWSRGYQFGMRAALNIIVQSEDKETARRDLIKILDTTDNKPLPQPTQEGYYALAKIKSILKPIYIPNHKVAIYRTRPTDYGIYGFLGNWTEDDGSDAGPKRDSGKAICVISENGMEFIDSWGHIYNEVGVWIGPYNVDWNLIQYIGDDEGTP